MRVAAVSAAWQLPGVAASEPLLKAGIVFAVLALTVFDRFGLKVTTEWSLPAAIAAMYALTALMLFTGSAELNRRGALAFVAVVTTAGLSFLVNHWF
jgi:hypothetical protein